jgi:hypothetical protein
VQLWRFADVMSGGSGVSCGDPFHGICRRRVVPRLHVPYETQMD